MLRNKTDQTYEDLEENLSLLGRENFYSNFHKEIVSIKGSMHLALCGSWGTGKTIFVKKLYKQLLDDNVLTFYMNAWQNDYYETPIFAFLANLLENKEFNDVFKAEVNQITKLYQNLTVGVPFLSVSMKVDSIKTDLFSQIRYSSLAQKTVTDVIKNYVAERGDRIIFIIDELDRCRPDFSIKLLEQLKHLAFDLNVTFLYVLDDSQLTLSMKTVYGQDYDTANYLHKIFDLMIDFPKLNEDNIERYIRGKVSDSTLWSWFSRSIFESQDVLDISLRDINRVIPYLEKVDRVSFFGQLKCPTDRNALKLILMIIALVKIKKPMLVRETLNNQRDISELAELFTGMNGVMQMLVNYKSNNPSLSDDPKIIIDFLFGNSGKSANIVRTALFEKD